MKTLPAIRCGLHPDGVHVVQYVVTQGIHPDTDSISSDVADLLHIGDQTSQFAYTLGKLAACVREIADGHSGCATADCDTCAAVYAATSLVHALDVVNGTALWVHGGAR